MLCVLPSRGAGNGRRCRACCCHGNADSPRRRHETEDFRPQREQNGVVYYLRRFTSVLFSRKSVVTHTCNKRAQPERRSKMWSEWQWRSEWGAFDTYWFKNKQAFEVLSLFIFIKVLKLFLLIMPLSHSSHSDVINISFCQCSILPNCLNSLR